MRAARLLLRSAGRPRTHFSPGRIGLEHRLGEPLDRAEDGPGVINLHKCPRNIGDGRLLKPRILEEAAEREEDFSLHSAHEIRELVIGGPPRSEPRPLESAAASSRAATDLGVRTGDFFGPHGSAELRGYPVRVSTAPAARDLTAAARLWNVSILRTGVDIDAALAQGSAPRGFPTVPTEALPMSFPSGSRPELP